MKTDFQRNQENAQDDLNENFKEIEEAITLSNGMLKSHDLEIKIEESTLYKSGTLHFTRIANIVIVDMRIELNGVKVQWKPLLEYPEGYKPANGAYPVGVMGSSSYAGQFGYMYTSAGAIQLLLTDTITKGTLGGTLMYTTNDPLPE